MFYSNTDNFVPYSKKGKAFDIRWSQCPVGQFFFVERSEEEVRSNKKRPSIPVAYQGKFKTKGGQHYEKWGYQILRVQ